jgi:chemotaxis protein MotB
VKKEHEEAHENSERWLLTYSDLITLLMIFFIVMYASSNVDVKKYNSLAQSLNTALGSGGGGSMIGNEGGGIVDLGGVGSVETGSNAQSAATAAEQIDMQKLEGELNNYLKEEGLDKSAVVQLNERGLGIVLKDSIVFDSGIAEIRDVSIDKIVKIGRILNKTNSYVRVEGHTDNVPINTQLFKSNWQLSSIRAANVVELLISQAGMSPDKISAVGYGEFRPIADNSTSEGRAKNRRVEIIIVNSKFNNIENNK